MGTVVDVFLVILLAAASLLCVYLISTLIEVKKTLAALRIDIKDVIDKVNPILSNVAIVTDKAASLTLEVEDQIAALLKLIKDAKEKIGNIFDTNKYERQNGEHSGPAWFRKVTGFYKGFSAFLSALKS